MKAVATVVVYDIDRGGRYALHGSVSEEQRRQEPSCSGSSAVGRSRGGETKCNDGVAQEITADSDPIAIEFTTIAGPHAMPILAART